MWEKRNYLIVKNRLLWSIWYHSQTLCRYALAYPSDCIIEVLHLVLNENYTSIKFSNTKLRDKNTKLFVIVAILLSKSNWIPVLQFWINHFYLIQNSSSQYLTKHGYIVTVIENQFLLTCRHRLSNISCTICSFSLSCSDDACDTLMKGIQVVKLRHLELWHKYIQSPNSL